MSYSTYDGASVECDGDGPSVWDGFYAPEHRRVFNPSIVRRGDKASRVKGDELSTLSSREILAGTIQPVLSGPIDGD